VAALRGGGEGGGGRGELKGGQPLTLRPPRPPGVAPRGVAGAAAPGLMARYYEQCSPSNALGTLKEPQLLGEGGAGQCGGLIRRPWSCDEL
jgi:hypothetical protein